MQKVVFPRAQSNRFAGYCGLPTMFFAILVAVVMTAGSGFASSVTVLHDFTGGPDGSNPDGNLVADASGNLYGTTYTGGGASSSGTIFKLTPPVSAGGAWTETVLYTFTGGSDGAQPGAGLIFGASGALFGTAEYSNGRPAGTVFRLAPPANPGGMWSYSVLKSFQGSTDGAAPNCNLIFDSAGALYGTTTLGGTSGLGTIFKLIPPGGATTPWSEVVLYNFTGGVDGGRPMDGLVIDPSGNLYGTATIGGDGNVGTAYKLVKPTVHGNPWTYQRLWSFSSAPDGAYPIASLVIDPSGSLFGTTWLGGRTYGTAFKLIPPAVAGGAWKENILHAFTGTDGSNPSAPLVYNAVDGSFYGATMGYYVGTGNVFKLTPPISAGGGWTESVLYTFQGAPTDSSTPISGLILDGAGAVYSISYYGGTFNRGSIFKITP